MFRRRVVLLRPPTTTGPRTRPVGLPPGAAFITALVGLLLASLPAPAQAQIPTSDATIAALEEDGRYLEFETSDEIDTAIDRANDAGVAIVWVDDDSVSQADARVLLLDLESATDRYDTILLLGNNEAYAWSTGRDPAQAALVSLTYFGGGDVAGGFDAFTRTLENGSDSARAGDATGAEAGDSGSDSGWGLSWLSLLVLGVVGVLGILWLLNRRTAAKREEELIELDRTEIAEQVRDNADRVIELGDRVIASGEPELITLYEEASAGYQEVSTSLPEASTVEEIDQLDDRIDRAEWQFEVIEARLEGRTPPEPPRAEPPPAPSRPGARTHSPQGVPGDEGASTTRIDEPALGPDESIVSGPHPSGTIGSRRPPRRPSTGLGGPGGWGGLGGMLGGVVLGGATRPRRASRRSRQRRSTTGSWTGGLGGGGSFGSPGPSSRRGPGRGGGGKF